MSNYVDNNTVHSYHKTVNEVNEKLKLDFKLVITWFHENRMLVNPGKCHYMCLDSKTEKAEFSFVGKTFVKSKEETVSDVTVDKKLTFYNHIKGLCQKAFHEISALSWISRYLDSSKKRLVVTADLYGGSGQENPIA